MSNAATFRLALAGNPNSGKTSIFNAMTGARQHVGNYPGVTVEKRVGYYRTNGTSFELFDLPGTYSLTSFSPEERIAQDELLEGRHDVVVVVADSTTLERSLVLLAQVMRMGVRIVLCLNMTDEAEKAGQRIDVEQMEALLGSPVIQTIGSRGGGVDALKSAVSRALDSPLPANHLVLGKRLDEAVAAIRVNLESEEVEPHQRDWFATKLLIGEPEIVERFAASTNGGRNALAEASKQRERLEEESGRDISMYVTEQYFGFVRGLLREVVEIPSKPDARAGSDFVDSVLVHRKLGLPIFAAVMYLIFWLTFTVGEIPMGWLESGFGLLATWVTSLWPAGTTSPLKSLLVDGLIGGVGGVIVFLPNILLLFLGLALLEDTGYMARAAFLMDRVMHRFGLHGKSFVPMITGFGCSIPAVMATRTLENERDRLTTMMVVPLMSCGARLPIWLLLVPAFFAPSWRAPALWMIYSTGIVLALLLALALRRSILKGEDAPFVMELPPYRLPTLKAIVIKMTERSWLYMRKAGTIILGISVVMWFVTSYPKPSEYSLDRAIAAGSVTVVPDDTKTMPTAAAGVEVITETQADGRRSAQALEYSAAGRVGRAMEPLIAPLGFDWKIGTALLGSFAAKEVFVAQMGIVYSLGEADEESEGLRETLAKDFSPLVAISLILFLLIATPCMATIAITRRESNSWKWPLLQFGGLTVIAYLISLAVFQIGSLFV